MALSVADFWNVFAESQLLAPDQLAQFAAAFNNVKGAAHASGATLAEWLIAQNVISRYQASVLLAGKSGPFAYGEYRVYDRIEAGRFAGLFRAIHAPTSHPVLLSFLPAAIAEDEEQLTHIARTLARVGNVSSPYLRRCYDLVSTGRFHFLACEDLHGGTLAQKIPAGQPIPPPEYARLIYEAACGVAALHTVGLVHGLPVPEQVWITEAGHVKLLHDPTRIPGPLPVEALATSDDRPVPSDYMAPELFFPDQPPNVSSDIYALGCVFYQLLSGRPPFAGGAAQEKAPRHASEPIVPLDYFGVPPQLAQVVSYMLAKDQRVRFANVTRLLEALTPFIHAAAITPPPPPATAVKYEASAAQRRARIGPVAPIEPAASFAPAPFSPTRQPPLGQDFAPPPQQMSMSLPQLFPQPTPSLDFPQSSYGTSDAAPLFDELPSPASSPASSPSMSTPAMSARPSAGVLEMEPLAAPAKTRTKPRRDNNTALVGIGIAAVAVLAVAVGLLTFFSNRTNNDTTGDGTKTLAQPNDPAEPSSQNTSPANTPLASTDKPSNQDKPSGDPASRDQKPPTTQPGDPPVKDKTSPPGEANPDAGNTETVAANAPREEVIEDDGAALWASPTAGQPIEARLIGLGAQALFVVRPIELLQSVEGQRFFAALGPAGQTLRATIESTTGAKFETIESVHIAIYAGPDGSAARMSYAVQLRDAANVAELAKGWAGASAGAFEGKQLYASEKMAYYLPAWGANRWLAVGPIEIIQDAIRQGEHPVTLGASVDKLLFATDATRQLTFVAAPQFLFDETTHFFSGIGERLRQPILDFFGDDVRALAISAHITDENSFAELRVLGTLGRKPDEYASRYYVRLGKLAEQIENAQVGAKFSPYGEKTLRRFPRMLGEVALNVRAGIDDGQAVIRCYLPPRAAHNLAQATDLAVHEAAGASGGSSGTASAGPTLAGVAGKLTKKISVSFPKEALDRALEIWGAEVGVKVVMLGPDMQLEGITKNQPINNFDAKDKSAESVLLDLLKIANPQGKLVYIIKPEKPGGEDVVQITTRVSAAKRKDKLPPSLAEDPSASKGPKKPVPRKK